MPVAKGPPTFEVLSNVSEMLQIVKYFDLNHTKTARETEVMGCGIRFG